MNNNKLIMTLLVRDEEDIVEENICFHLNMGVDHIMVTDNRSVDGTRDILEKYSKKKVLSYVLNNEDTYEQAKWVSEMAYKAVNELRATHLFHCDADEFWSPKKGSNLKKYIDNVKGVCGVKLLNYLPPHRTDTTKNNFKHYEYAVVNPIPYPKDQKDLKSSEILLYEYPMKVITTDENTTIGYGNHCTDKVSNDMLEVNSEIIIHHFPIRNYYHFERKVINGGKAIMNNPDGNSGLCWHWRKWYELYREGKLLDEYYKISGNKQENIVKSVEVPWYIQHSKSLFRLKLAFFKNH